MTFQILRIAANSDHPVRNTAGVLIFRNHVLWEGEQFHDGDKGSLAPNIFFYDFTSPLAQSSLLDITIKAHHWEAFPGAQYRLRGVLGESKVFESDAFSLGSEEDIVTVAAGVIKPRSSSNPLAFNGTFTWTLQQDPSDDTIAYADKKTRLELYWISADIYEDFLDGLSGIKVEYLRCVFNRNAQSDISHPSNKIPEGNREDSDKTVRGISSTFKVHCHLDGSIAFASADVERHGLLLTKVTTEANETDTTSKTSKVTFTFVTRLVGIHQVDLRFAEAVTMSARKRRIQVTVIDA